MARVHAFGSEFNASVVEGPLANGNYKMMAQERFSRGEAGTVIEVKPSEIISANVGGATFNLGGQIAANNAAPPGALLVVNSPVPVTGTEIAARAPLLSPTAIRPPVRTPMAASATPAPVAHFQGLVDGLRTDIKSAVAGAKALKARGTTSIAAFTTAQAQLSAVYDELDAATTEITGALLEPGSNGTDAKNSSGT